MDLKTSLSAKLSETELKLLPRAFEVVGDIAILELPEELLKKRNL